MARAPEKADSVYDFLYVDARRIGVLVSQLGGGQDGVMTEQIRKTSTSSKSGGGLNIPVVKLDHEEGEDSGLSRTFDPRWLQPLRFYLAQDRIVRDLSSARVGQLVLAQGEVSFHDYTFLMAILNQPAVRRRLARSDKIDWSEATKTLALDDISKPKQQTPALTQKKLGRIQRRQ